MTDKKPIERDGLGRRIDPQRDGTCALHPANESCHAVMKDDIKGLEALGSNNKSRISAIEPQVEHNATDIESIRGEISGMKKLMIGTLVSAMFAAISTITGLLFYIINSYSP